MADPVVHLTNGVPDAGTGNITTLGQTLLDGANVTIGAKADAKSTATDATPASAISIWKQISASVQALVSNAVSLGQNLMSASMPTVLASDYVLTKALTGYYLTVAASQTAQVLQSSAGVAGDYVSGILVIPATTSPGNIILLDNATSITVFAGGSSSVSNLVPFFIPIGAFSRSGAWKLTTGANVSCIAVGKFS
jgi:hypothetical protein